MNKTSAQRLAARSQVTATGCIEYTGYRDPRGYGQMSDKPGGRQMTHRIAWEISFGPIPVGMNVLHRCDNPPCVNPEHLFLGTKKQNSEDMVAKGRHFNQRKTLCPSGHPYSGENLRLVPTPAGGVGRVCVICATASKRRYKLKMKAAS